MKPKTQRTIAIGIGAVGFALVIMMITMEGELGALPLGLMLLGGVGYVTGRMRERPNR